MPEEPLSDHELRIVRGMIDEHTRERYLSDFWHSAFGVVVRVVSALGAIAIFAAAVEQLFRHG